MAGRMVLNISIYIIWLEKEMFLKDWFLIACNPVTTWSLFGEHLFSAISAIQHWAFFFRQICSIYRRHCKHDHRELAARQAA